MPAKYIWTADMDTALRAMVNDGAFAREIGERIGVPRHAIFTRCEQLGLSLYNQRARDRHNAVRRKHGSKTINIARAVVYQGEVNERRCKAIYRTRCRKLYPDLPEHLWPVVNEIRTRHSLLSSEAYAVVMADWKRDVLAAMRAICNAAAEYACAELARRNSFAGQLERVRNGARLVTVVRQRAIEHDRSLVGCAAGMAVLS